MGFTTGFYGPVNIHLRIFYKTVEFLCVGRCPASPVSWSLGLLAQRFTVAGGSAAENLNKIGDLTAAGLSDPRGRQPKPKSHLSSSASQPTY